MTNYYVIKKLIGNIEPIGDSRVDEKRFDNLKETTLLVEQLLRDISAVVPFSSCSRASMNKAGRWAKESLDGFKRDLDVELQEKKPEPKTFDIDCAGNVMLRVEITGNVPTVLCAMNGYGNSMEISEFNVKPVEKEVETVQEDVEPEVILEGHFECSRCGKHTPESERAWKPFTDMCTDCAPF